MYSGGPFAGVCNHRQATRANLREYTRELRRRVPDLAGIKPEAAMEVIQRLQFGQRVNRVLLGEMAEVRDQPPGDAELGLAIVQRPHNASTKLGDHAARCASAGRRRFRAPRRRPGALQIRPGEIVEIVLVAQHIGTGVVEVEKPCRLPKL